jgi:cell filamentation protein
VTEPVPDWKQRWDAYFSAPGSGVLRNKIGARSSLELHFGEYRLRALRQTEIERGDVDIPRTFDKAHLQAIHRHLLQDVYDWAGQFRNVGMEKGGKPFAPYQQVDELVEAVGAAIRKRDWPTMSRQEFVENIALIYVCQNLAHPFREGNGATDKLYLSHVAELSPYRLDFDRVEKAEWKEAADASRAQDPAKEGPDASAMYAVFDKITVERTAAAVADPDLAKAVLLHNTTYRSTGASTQQSGTGMGKRPPTYGASRGNDRGAEAGWSNAD